MKVGDKVRILSKSKGWKIEATTFKIGDVGEVIDAWNSLTSVADKDGVHYLFHERDLELVPKFKVGDKVKIKDEIVKTKILNDNKEEMVGKEYYIQNISNNEYIYINDWLWHIEDLELIPKKEGKVKYEKLKYINGKEIEKAQGNLPCNEFNKYFIDYLKEFGYEYEPDFNTLMDWAGDREKEFLVNHKFIKKVEEFEPFELKLKIKNRDQLHMLWHRLNCYESDFRKAYGEIVGYIYSFGKANTSSLWKQVDNTCKRLGCK